MAVGNPLSLVASIIFTEHFREMALDTTDHKPAKWLRYFDNTFMVWPHGPARLQQFLHHLNSLGPTMKFTIKVESNDTLPFLDVLVIKSGPKLAAKVCQKSTHPQSALQVQPPTPHEKGSFSEFDQSYVGIRGISTRKLRT
jgi:hypothetical protein